MEVIALPIWLYATVPIYESSHEVPCAVSAITLEGQNIEKVDKFQYLGSYLSENGDVDVDIL